jgi:hypothetical protein
LHERLHEKVFRQLAESIIQRLQIDLPLHQRIRKLLGKRIGEGLEGFVHALRSLNLFCCRVRNQRVILRGQLKLRSQPRDRIGVTAALRIGQFAFQLQLILCSLVLLLQKVVVIDCRSAAAVLIGAPWPVD